MGLVSVKPVSEHIQPVQIQHKFTQLEMWGRTEREAARRREFDLGDNLRG